MKTLRRNTNRFFSLSVMILLGILLSGCNAQSEESINHSEQAQKADAGPALSEYHPLDGFAQSLEPLSAEQCFGEKHKISAVRKLLDEMYAEEGYPISGMGVLLGADTRSIASKNKEFRYVFNSPLKQDEAIKEAVLNYIEEFLDLIGFTVREYPINDRNNSPKDAIVPFDLPVLIIENSGRTEEELEKYEAYFMRYAHWFDDFIYKKLNRKNLQLQDEIQKFTIYKKDAAYQLHSYSRGGGYIFDANEIFNPQQLRGEKLIQDFFYAVYKKNKKALTREQLYTSKISINLISAFFVFSINGNALSVEQSSINTLIDKQNVAKLEKGKEELTPYPFDKSLFIAVYDRIKPVHMSKQNYIDAVLTVMEPCLY